MTNLPIESRLNDFITVTKYSSQARNFIETVGKNPSLFPAAMDLLESMAATGQKFKNALSDEAVEDVIVKTRSMEMFDTQKDSDVVRKIDLLLSMGTKKAIENSAAIFHDIKSEGTRQGISKRILSDLSSDGLRKANLFIRRVEGSLELGYSYPFSAEITEFYKQHTKALFQIASDAKNPSQKTAYGIIAQQARRNHHLDSIKFLNDFGTRESYRDFRNALISMGGEKHKAGAYSLEAVVFHHLVNKPAYLAYMTAIDHNKTEETILLAERKFKNHLSKEDAAPYLARLASWHAEAFTKLEAEQCKTKITDFSEEHKYINSALNYAPKDAGRAMKMIGRCAYSDVRSMLNDLADKYDQKDLCIDLLLQRGGRDSVIYATNMLLQNHDQENTSDCKALQERKTLAIQKLSAVDETSWANNPELAKVIQVYAQFGTFANEETTELVLKELINKNNQRSLILARNILFQSDKNGYTYHCDSKDTSSAKIFVPFTVASKEARVFAFGQLMNVDKPHKAACELIRDTANSLGEHYPQQALDYFYKEGSESSLGEVKHLKGNVDIFASFKALPPKQAIDALTKAFNQNAVGALNALMDLREQAIGEGENDLAAYDAPIIKGVRKVAGRDTNLIRHIREDDREQLKPLFDRLADASLVDARQRYNAALKIVDCIDALGEAQKEMMGVPIVELNLKHL